MTTLTGPAHFPVGGARDIDFLMTCCSWPHVRFKYTEVGCDRDALFDGGMAGASQEQARTFEEQREKIQGGSDRLQQARAEMQDTLEVKCCLYLYCNRFSVQCVPRLRTAQWKTCNDSVKSYKTWIKM